MTRFLRLLHQRCTMPWLVSLLMLASVAACGQGMSTGPGGLTGGAPATGGAQGTGGTAGPASGGAPGTGGARATTGGSSGAGSGGATGTPSGGASGAGGAKTDAGGRGGGGWHLVWADEFDADGPPNPANWGFERGFVRNEELQWYQPENASCSGGLLVIEGRREPRPRPNPSYQAGSSDWKRSRQNIEYTSSSLTTSGKHSFTYGRFEIRARIDARAGSWPAFWSLPSGVAWPQGGEVDIMEYFDNHVLANVCIPAGTECAWSSVRQPLSRLGGTTWSSAFHVWAMEWDSTRIDLFLDDLLVNHFLVSDAASAGGQNPYRNRPFYVIVNQAIGGSNGGDPGTTVFPLRYEIDWVRIYQR